jgi:hypothetical protein
MEKTRVSIGTLAGEGRYDGEAHGCPPHHMRDHGQMRCGGPVHQRQILNGALLYDTDRILKSGTCDILLDQTS